MTVKFRTDRVISINGQIHSRLVDQQARLAGQLGFKPTLAQTIEWLVNKAEN